MATFQDCSLGMVKEGSYGTNTTVTRWLEFVDETLDYNKEIKQGQGLRVGTRVARSARRVPVTTDAGGDITVELISKGLGILLEACFGTSAVNLVAGSTYQHMFTLGDLLPSLTIQKGIVDTAGAVNPHTFLGCTIDSWEIDCGNGEIANLKATVDAKDVVTATAYAAPSYAAGANLFTFKDGAISTGTLTAPTTTTIASAATPIASVRSFNLKGSNNVAGDRYMLGGGGKKAKPTVGLREITGSAEVEYDSALFRDAVLADSAMSLVLTFTGTGALSTGFETLQIVLPEVKFDGKLPASNAGELITISTEFTVLDNLTAAQPIWVILRTSDAAI